MIYWIDCTTRVRNIYRAVVSPPPVHFTDGINFKFAPLSGIANRKTIHCNENGYYSIYQSDRYGFNNPDKEWDQKDIEFLLPICLFNCFLFLNIFIYKLQ